jgi:hypothetical protein
MFGFDQCRSAGGGGGKSTLVADPLTFDASLLFIGHALLLCPKFLHLEHIILAPNFLILFGFFESLLSSRPLFLNFLGLLEVILTLGVPSCHAGFLSIVPHWALGI